MRIRILGVAIGASAALALATATPAQAHGTYYDWWIGCGIAGAQDCGRAWVSSSHRTITVCDDTPDGNRVFVQYVRGGIGHRLSDRNGAKSGCGKAYNSAGISKWRMCVDYGSYNVCIKDWIDT